MAKKKTARIEIVTTPELKEQAQKAAVEKNHSLNSYVEVLIKKDVAPKGLPGETEEARAFALGTNPLHDLNEAPKIVPPKDDWLNS